MIKSEHYKIGKVYQWKKKNVNQSQKIGANLIHEEMSLREKNIIKTAKALKDRVRPTHFITLSLCQARKINRGHNEVVHVKGDDIIYERVHQGFIRSLSKPLCSRRSWRAHKPMVRSAAVIEGGKNGARNHLHTIVAKPERIHEMKFRLMVIRSAVRNPWVMKGKFSVNIQSIASSDEAMNVTRYILKEGVDRIRLT